MLSKNFVNLIAIKATIFWGKMQMLEKERFQSNRTNSQKPKMIAKSIIAIILVVIVILLVVWSVTSVQEQSRLTRIAEEKAYNSELYQELLSEYENLYTIPLSEVDEIISKATILKITDYASKAAEIESSAFEYLELCHNVWSDYADITYENFSLGAAAAEVLAQQTLSEKYGISSSTVQQYFEAWHEYIADNGEYAVLYFD